MRIKAENDARYQEICRSSGGCDESKGGVFFFRPSRCSERQFCYHIYVPGTGFFFFLVDTSHSTRNKYLTRVPLWMFGGEGLIVWEKG